jgi:hypothetical protein
MCGIVGERLIKDVLRASVCVRRYDKIEQPSDDAFDHLEKVEVRGLMLFGWKAGLLRDDAKRAAVDLGEHRNTYAHARGKEPVKDAMKALTLLHAIVESTVSILAIHDIREGKFVRKEQA